MADADSVAAAGTPTAQRLPTPLRLALATIAILGFLLAGLVFLIEREADRLMAERTVSTLAGELDILRRARDNGGLPALTALVRERSSLGHDLVYFLKSAEGSRLAGNVAIEPKLAAGGSRLYQLSATTLDGRPRAAAGVNVPAGEGATLMLLRDIEDAREFSVHLQRLALGAAALIAILGLSGGLFVSGIFNRRLSEIAKASGAFVSGDLTRRIPRDGKGDEIDTLAANLNAMLERIEELLAALREVSDNIAHDLKTPLTRLRNSAEAALRDPAGEPAYRLGLERTLDEADSLLQTFNALLLIARLEAGAVDESKSTVDVTELATDMIELYQPLADEAGLSLTANIAPGLFAEINRQLVSQALANMIENAIKYSPTSAAVGQIRVSADRNSGGELVLAVTDSGPGIPAEDREKVLKRFVRLEQSRSQPGTGLGLSLVAAVARLHNGRVELLDNDPGLVITLTIPPVIRART